MLLVSLAVLIHPHLPRHQLVQHRLEQRSQRRLALLLGLDLAIRRRQHAGDFTRLAIYISLPFVGALSLGCCGSYGQKFIGFTGLYVRSP